MKSNLKEIDSTFDLMLMFENFQESIVLLKHSLGWNYTDLASLKLNVHENSSKSNIDDQARNELRKWLKNSYIFYDHFKVSTAGVAQH